MITAVISKKFWHIKNDILKVLNAAITALFFLNPVDIGNQPPFPVSMNLHQIYSLAIVRILQNLCQLKCGAATKLVTLIHAINTSGEKGRVLKRNMNLLHFDPTVRGWRISEKISNF